ncbi:MAG: YbjQ family protein [Candidatus Mcinerneyibacterium aminivorans]|uniref:UPF0145 protein FXF47_05080 n=1 Tax=Candidatus Mcinerneyibacterium aminivorans TaxID=2703815 RepID=A0A5D0MID4_9BACT|nr:MAG: YbjQ family protein [Candidatus Mcinerneyibacterium aminivorans]
MIITTSENVAGKKVSETLGMVKGNTIKARHVGSDMVASIKKIFGGEIKGYTKMINSARQQAIERMEKKAEEMGADAVISVRFTTSEVMQGAAEILVYGTAVKFK